ncbi:DSBA family oxidoreductase [Fusarium solani]|uniref:Glutathione S-transferase kappa n=1 Tax=Fusarium solani TaxID=169388 RepID=A0A9P9JMV0_FUSSL|nr:DSBA family oxidoreductase [Fusarium solani]KAH7230847.1 DSBA family oxidoreductase [Fusarium solani]
MPRSFNTTASVPQLSSLKVSMASHKKIELYFDCVSPYSFYAFLYLTQRKQALQNLNVELELIPVFLGGINVGSGNKPPWTLPAKAAYSSYDTKRAQKYFGLKFTVPEFFPILSLLPQRCLTVVKTSHPEKFEALCRECFEALWLNHKDLSKPENMMTVLQAVFDTDEAKKVAQGAQSLEVKQKLNDVTSHAVEKLGAFGCPWFWVQNGKGKAEPFFGSDRFHYMWDYLELPHQDLELSAPARGKL